MFSVKLFSLIFTKAATVTATSTAPIPDEPEACSLMRSAYDKLVVSAKHNDLSCAAPPIPYEPGTAKRNSRTSCSPAKAVASNRSLSLWRSAMSKRHSLAWPVSAREARQSFSQCIVVFASRKQKMRYPAMRAGVVQLLHRRNRRPRSSGYGSLEMSRTERR
jgi:hypothetical protein